MIEEYFIRYKFDNTAKLGMEETQGKVLYAVSGHDAIKELKKKEEEKGNDVIEIIDVKLLEN